MAMSISGDAVLGGRDRLGDAITTHVHRLKKAAEVQERRLAGATAETLADQLSGDAALGGRIRLGNGVMDGDALQSGRNRLGDALQSGRNRLGDALQSGRNRLGDVKKGYEEHQRLGKLQKEGQMSEREILDKIDGYRKVNLGLMREIKNLTGRDATSPTIHGKGISSYFAGKVDKLADTIGLRMADLHRRLDSEIALSKLLGIELRNAVEDYADEDDHRRT